MTQLQTQKQEHWYTRGNKQYGKKPAKNTLSKRSEFVSLFFGGGLKLSMHADEEPKP